MSCFACANATRCAAPSQPVSSPAVMIRVRPGPWRSKSARSIAATTNAATPLFMSLEPRPYRRPSTISAPKGSCCQGAAPSGTTSTWPVKHSGSRPGLPPMRATRLLRRGANSTRRQTKPAPDSRSASWVVHKSSCPGGFTVFARTRAWVSATASIRFMTISFQWVGASAPLAPPVRRRAPVAAAQNRPAVCRSVAGPWAGRAHQSRPAR